MTNRKTLKTAENKAIIISAQNHGNISNLDYICISLYFSGSYTLSYYNSSTYNTVGLGQKMNGPKLTSINSSDRIQLPGHFTQ